MKHPTSAFPHEGVSTGETFIRPSPGMSLRDYMATHLDAGDLDALNAATGEKLLGAPMPDWRSDPVANLRWWADYRAAIRYMEVDAMLGRAAKGGAR